MQGTKVLVTRMLPGVAVELLKENGFVVTAWTEEMPMTQEQLIAQAKNHEALLCSLTDKIDPYFLSQCSHLKVISQFGVGYDNINIPEATRLKIPVGNTPDVLTDATADVAFALMINASRKMFYQHKLIEKGQWKSFKTMSHLGIELKGKTLGIFGLGRIGNVMAKRCVGAFDMKVIYHNRNPLSPDQNHFNARYVSFDELAAESDVLSVHASLSDSTRGLFDKNVFSKMKPTSIFVNTARGAVHNEIDLIEALKTGKIWGAGLDVTNPEPMQPDNPLLQMENVAVLPHIGSATIEARTGMARLAAENIIGFFKEGRVPNLVNKELAGNN